MRNYCLTHSVKSYNVFVGTFPTARASKVPYIKRLVKGMPSKDQHCNLVKVSRFLFWQCALRSGKSELTRKISPRRKIWRNFSKTAGIVSTKSCHCPITFSHAQFHFPTPCYASYKVFFLIAKFCTRTKQSETQKIMGKNEGTHYAGPLGLMHAAHERTVANVLTAIVHRSTLCAC